jgi:CubicO group peptidase (beta-lactamase class C family)
MKLSAPADQIGAELRAFVPPLMEAWNVPATSVALVQDGKIAWLGSFGLTNRKTLQPVHEGTAFEAASLSKPMFALAALQLHEQGRLVLDVSLRRYVESPYAPGDSRADEITLRQALSHTTGFPNWRSERHPIRTYFPPGSRFGYSGEGYVYAQRAAERVEGTDLEGIARRRVFDPLKMLCSSYTWPIPGEHRVAYGHTVAGEPLPKRAWAQPNAAGSLHTTPEDYARFMVDVIGAGNGHNSLVSQATIREMLTPHVGVNGSDSQDADWPNLSATEWAGLSWGLGWGLEDTGDGIAMWQWGGEAHYKSFAIGCVEHACGVVVMTNSGTGWNLFRPILEVLSDVSHPSLDWLERVHWRRKNGGQPGGNGR